MMFSSSPGLMSLNLISGIAFEKQQSKECQRRRTKCSLQSPKEPYHIATKPRNRRCGERAFSTWTALLYCVCCICQNGIWRGLGCIYTPPRMVSSWNCVTHQCQDSHGPARQHFRNLDLSLCGSFYDRARIEGERLGKGMQ